MSREGRSQPIQPVATHGFVGNIPANSVGPRITIIENDDRRRRTPPLQPFIHNVLNAATSVQVFVGPPAPVNVESPRPRRATPDPVVIVGSSSLWFVKPPPPVNIEVQRARRPAPESVFIVGPKVGGTIKTLTGTSNITFTESSSLVKTAVISATDNITFAESVSLVKTAVLAPSDNIRFTEAATLVKTARIAPTANLTFAESVTLVKTAILNPSTSIRFTEAVNLVATHILAPTANLVFTETCALVRVSPGAVARAVSGFAPAILRLLGVWK